MQMLFHSTNVKWVLPGILQNSRYSEVNIAEKNPTLRELTYTLKEEDGIKYIITWYSIMALEKNKQGRVQGEASWKRWHLRKYLIEEGSQPCGFLGEECPKPGNSHSKSPIQDKNVLEVLASVRNSKRTGCGEVAGCQVTYVLKVHFKDFDLFWMG